MKRVLAVLLLLSAARPAPALTFHRSFRPTPVGTGGGTSVVVPAFTQRTGSQFQEPASRNPPKKTLVGTVTQVIDGDTVWVKPKGGAKTKVHLLRIDAPELDQPYGDEAKTFLSGLVLDRKVEVQYTAKDRTGAVVGVVFLRHEKGAVDVNLTMLLNGCAWKTDAPDAPAAYADGFAKARAAKIGLWAGTDPVAPGEWTKGARGGK